MASAIETQYPDDWRSAGNRAAQSRNKDAPTPARAGHAPPSPPATETEIDESESESVPFPDLPQSSHDAILEDESGASDWRHGTDVAASTTRYEPRMPPPIIEEPAPATTMKPTTENADTLLRPSASDPDFGTESDIIQNSSTTTGSPVPSPITSPPYWNWTPRTSQDRPPGAHGHVRTVSSTSVDSTGLGIILRDNENSSVDIDGRSNACWAKSVQVTDYVTINGSAVSNIGAFVVWNIRVETLTGSFMNIRKRYSEFDDFRWRLMRTFPGFEAAVPELPPKSLISKFRPRFLEKRRAGLQYFLNCILLNPEFSGSPILKEFLFS